MSGLEGGAFSVERCEADASLDQEILASALELAERQLSARDQSALQSWLSLGDFPIPTVDIRIPAGAEPRSAIAAQLAKRISSELRRAGPSPGEVAADRSKTANLLGRIAKKLGATQPLGLELTQREREIPREVQREVGRVIRGSFETSRPVDPESVEARAAAEAARQEERGPSRYFRKVFKRQVKDLATDVPVPIPVVEGFDRNMQGYARENGIEFQNEQFNLGTLRMLVQNKMPCVNPDAENFQEVYYGHNEKMPQAVRHEAVHTMHVTQARVTIMRQVCAAYLVSAPEELPPEGRAEIHERVNRLESGGNYPRFEVMATRIGGAGGRVKTPEREYRREMLRGSNEMARALKRDDLKLEVRSPWQAWLAAQFGARAGKGMWEALFNVGGASGIYAAGSMGALGAAAPVAWGALLVWLATRQPEFGDVIGALLRRMGAKY